MGTADITSSRRKLRRAKVHLDALASEMKSATNQKTHSTRIELRQEGVWQVVYLTLGFSPPPEWAMMIGDAVNNMRAALDHLIWQLVLRDDNEPRDTHAFPIFTDREQFIEKVKAPPKKTEQRSPLYGIIVDGDAWTVIEGAQPFNRPEPEMAEFELLANLRQMSNLDKHWGVLVQAPFPNLKRLDDWIGWRHGLQYVERIDHIGPLVLEQPAEICRLRFADANPGMYVKGQPIVHPTFGSGEFQVSAGRFRNIFHRVEEIVDQIGGLPNVKWDDP